jgi:hypothetical protein
MLILTTRSFSAQGFRGPVAVDMTAATASALTDQDEEHIKNIQTEGESWDWRG